MKESYELKFHFKGVFQGGLCDQYTLTFNS